MSKSSALLRAAVRPLVLAPLLATALLGGPTTSGPAASLDVASDRIVPVSSGSVSSGSDAVQTVGLTILDRRTSRRLTARKTIAPVAQIKPKPEPRKTWALPIRDDYRLTGRFGARSGLWSSSHTGLDFAASFGTKVVAVTDGVVTAAGYAGAYGMRTIITGADGTEYWYAHQSSVSVAVGERVLAGSEIGQVGSTGNSTGPHLHLEVRPAGGSPQDPAAVLGNHGLHP